MLERYQTWRRFDTFRMGVTTDVLNRLFSNDVMPVRIARDVGLGIVDTDPEPQVLLHRAGGRDRGQEQSAAFGRRDDLIVQPPRL